MSQRMKLRLQAGSESGMTGNRENGFSRFQIRRGE